MAIASAISKPGYIEVHLYDRMDLNTIINSGQIFRYEVTGNKYTFFKGSHRINIIQLSSKWFKFHCSMSDFRMIWSVFFDLQTDYDSIINSWSDTLNNDQYFMESLKFNNGMRILRQDLWETIVSFMISQNNNITRIRNTVNNLCDTLGSKIVVGDESYSVFPNPDQLSNSNLSEFHLGYREKWIKDFATKCTSDSQILSDIRIGSYTESMDLLRSIRGIGNKVANCVCLYSLHHMGAFPMDTWMNKINDMYYNGNLDPTKFGACAGLAQQLMFYYERNK